MKVHEYFDRIFCVNLDRRTDRWQDCLAEARKHDIQGMERFSAVEYRDAAGAINPVVGCAMSHRAILDNVLENRWPRTLILEDDFQVVVPSLNTSFSAVIDAVPADWDMLYLGCNYVREALGKVNAHVIRSGGVLTASSYGVTFDFVQRFTDKLSATGGHIDVQYMELHPIINAYVLHPRLIVQRPGYSDLCGSHQNYTGSMMDR